MLAEIAVGHTLHWSLGLYKCMFSCFGYHFMHINMHCRPVNASQMLIVDCSYCWLADGTFGWLVKGGVLEVFGMQTGERWASWCFSSTAADTKTIITAVCQFGIDCSATWLALATAQDDFNSFKICLFDVCKSSIVKAVQLPYLVCLNFGSCSILI